MENKFKDINLKFGVIGSLGNVDQYAEEGRKIKQVKSYSREYQEASYSYVVQEVYDYYVTLNIPQEQLDQIYVFKPRMICYNLMIKEWDGEDDFFDIKSLDGIEQLYNLKEFYPDMMSREDANISALLECPQLQIVHVQHLPDTENVQNVLEQLRKKGVTIIE